MIKYTKGNLLEAPTQALVNTVNTVGVMGKGIALQFKEKFPANRRAYEKACKDGWLKPGKLLVVRESTLDGEKIIINFPTKTEWYKKSSYQYIESGLNELLYVINNENISSIAIPPLGCGNGGLHWDKVKEMMEQCFSPLNETEFLIYEPNTQVKEHLRKQKVNHTQKLTPARAMLLYAMFYYESMGESSSLFVANKLAYFLKRLGEPSLSRLKFEASHYGPYSVQVGHMLHHINGKYIRGLEQMEAKAFEPLELQYATMQEVSIYVKKQLSFEQRDRLRKLISLIDGFQSALSLEVLATVDFIRKEQPGITVDGVIRNIQDWSDRKNQLIHERHVQIAFSHLEDYSAQPIFS